jgi:hypothetical protein
MNSGAECNSNEVLPMSTLSGNTVFPCPVCTELRDVRMTKKSTGIEEPIRVLCRGEPLEHRVIEVSEQRNSRIAPTEFYEKWNTIQFALELFRVVPIVWQNKSARVFDAVHRKHVAKEASSSSSVDYPDKSLLDDCSSRWPKLTK